MLLKRKMISLSDGSFGWSGICILSEFRYFAEINGVRRLEIYTTPETQFCRYRTMEESTVLAV